MRFSMTNCIIPFAWLWGHVDRPPPVEPTQRDSSSRTHADRHRLPTPTCGANSRGELLSVRLIQHYDQQSLGIYWDSWLNGLAALGYVEDTVDPEIQNGASSFKVTYCTVDFDGAPIVGSGMLAMPSTWGTAPTVMYSHGTAVTRFDTPSNPDVDAVFDGPTGMVIFAGHGYIYLAPDLTGFGDSSASRHRYLHSDTEAKSSLDMLTAVDDYWPYALKADGRLFNAGYSAGGHSALAFAAAAEEAGVEIEATSVGGAVVNPDEWFEWCIEQVDNSYLQVYPAALLISYDAVYGDAYDDPSDTFAAPFDVMLDELFDMTHTYEEVIKEMPGSTAELLTRTFFEEIHDADSAIRVHLRENALEDVCLDSPIRMLHMIGDDEVPYELAVDALAQLGICNDVELVNWIGTDHLNTWHQTLPEVRSWFDTF
jgi:pimeloyl-ACP methyl ester carboxylesterase